MTLPAFLLHLCNNSIYFYHERFFVLFQHSVIVNPEESGGRILLGSEKRGTSPLGWGVLIQPNSTDTFGGGFSF
jgi:hypothetical protein